MPIHKERLVISEEHLERAHRYPVTVEEEDGSLVARTPDPAFPCVIGVGATQEAATAELVQNLAGQLALAERLGEEIPPPLDDCGNPLSVRLPRSVHRALKARASAEGISVSQTITLLLTEGLALQSPKPRRKKAGAGT